MPDSNLRGLKQPPREEVVAMLASLLTKAKAGELIAVAVAGVGRHSTHGGFAGVESNMEGFHLIGALEGTKKGVLDLLGRWGA